MWRSRTLLWLAQPFAVHIAGDWRAVEANADFLQTLPTPVPIEKHMSAPLRLRADRFARVLDLSFAESRDLYAELTAEPTYVDADGYVHAAADSAPGVLALPAGKQTGVLDQFKMVRAEQRPCQSGG